MASKDASEHVSASPKGGIAVFMLGAAAIGSAFVPMTRLDPAIIVYGYEAPIVQAAIGAGIAFIGAGWALWAITRPPPPRAAIEAHVAFKGRMAVEKGAHEHHAKTAAGVAVPRTKPVKTLTEAETLALAIKDVNQKIAKAKVMLGTGRLSADGYAKHVADLQAQLAELEARRMHLEFSSR